MKNRTFILNYYLMLIPGLVLLILFSVVPMLGVAIAFQDFNSGLGLWRSEWVGLDNFNYMFQLSDSRVIFINTISLAVMKIIANLIVPLVFALLLNEVRKKAFKRFVQTVVYLPHFLSWVILAGILTDMFSYHGLVNQLFGAFGFEPVLFLASNTWFPAILVSSDVWKEFGFNTIIYLAALTGINSSLYEAAAIDGAGRGEQLWHITLPGIRPTIVLLATLSLGNVLNAGFDQIYNMYNPLVYSSSDIIDTYVYRVGLLDVQYGLATAVGLLKSIVSLILIGISYTLASKFANYRIF
ncbi:putative aldouronate transport system permease protein [Paenibacillus catalpae]|uniref:Putative aldouronate transport system permease protein n=1 Tax=Paenibacillus catalpae TaxID=1045775 RepID=A0A1I1SR30_9BACL|nr:ABC transporter permease subunit [Paenibacillus catalpae]SFD48959.1 putative aldouronate transport system permease protein [Paenibacillus catalpae]